MSTEDSSQDAKPLEGLKHRKARLRLVVELYFNGSLSVRQSVVENETKVHHASMMEQIWCQKKCHSRCTKSSVKPSGGVKAWMCMAASG